MLFIAHILVSPDDQPSKARNADLTTAKIPRRQHFVSRVRVGGFFRCMKIDDSGEMFARVERIIQPGCNDTGPMRVEVMPLTLTDGLRHGLSLWKEDRLRGRHQLSIRSVFHPIHMVPACVSSKDCVIDARSSVPASLRSDLSCIGLGGAHAATDCFIHNPYFIK
jgi:hypothetical protein